MRTFLQVAAGAADIPVTRLLGQSPAGLSATGDSDTRNYYDMISARQELDLRPQLERLDGLLLRSAGVAPGALGFAFRPLWQLSAAERAGVALSKAQASAIYAGLGLWPATTTAALVHSQLLEDGTYPGAEAAFGAGAGAPEPASAPVVDYSPDQPRDPDGRWSGGGGASAAARAAEQSARTASTAQGTPSTKLGSVLSLPHPVGSGEAEEVHGPHSPDGTPIEPAGLRGKARGEALKSILRGALGIARHLGRVLVRETPESAVSPPSVTHLSPDQKPSAVLRGFAGPKSQQPWQNQMIKRGWTARQIEEAGGSGTSRPAENRVNPCNGATEYTHRKTGRYVVIDDTTKQVIQLGGDKFENQGPR